MGAAHPLLQFPFAFPCFQPVTEMVQNCPATAGTGTGWTFTPCSTEAFISVLAYSLQTYREHPDSFRGLQERGMQRDSSWNKAAEQYEQIFKWAKNDAPYCK